MIDQNLVLGKTNLDILSQTLMQLAENDRDIIVVASDSRGSGRVSNFAEKFPKQFVEIGIAEQNLVGVSAGLASVGKKVYAISPACFITSRAFEQIKNDIAYSDHPVKIIGISGGVSYGSLGTTHHSIHDFAALQAINNIDIVVPADNFETEQTIRLSVNYPRPLYIRFGKKPMPILYSSNSSFEIGKANQLTPEAEEYDVVFIASGETVAPAYFASQNLESLGVKSCVVSFHTIRPFDEETLTRVATRSKVVITVEEHSINGGLGSRVASFLMQSKIFCSFKTIGIPDEHTVTGSQGEIFAHYGISPSGLEKTALELIEKVIA